METVPEAVEPSTRLLRRLRRRQGRGSPTSVGFSGVCQDPFAEVPVVEERGVAEPEGGDDDRLVDYHLGWNLDRRWPGGQGRLDGHERHADRCRHSFQNPEGLPGRMRDQPRRTRGEERAGQVGQPPGSDRAPEDPAAGGDDASLRQDGRRFGRSGKIRQTQPLGQGNGEGPLVDWSRGSRTPFLRCEKDLGWPRGGPPPSGWSGDKKRASPVPGPVRDVPGVPDEMLDPPLVHPGVDVRPGRGGKEHEGKAARQEERVAPCRSALHRHPQCSVAHTHSPPVQKQRPGTRTGSQAPDGRTNRGKKMMEWGWRTARRCPK